jgi:dephospho-CoA kinase
VLEAPLLIEAGWASSVDEVWATLAPESVVLSRLMRKGLSKKEALARIHSQLCSKERVKYARIVIENDGDPVKLKAKVRKLWQELHARKLEKT